MKKWLRFLLAAMLMLSLTGCADDSSMTSAIVNQVADVVVEELTDSINDAIDDTLADEEVNMTEEAPEEDVTDAPDAPEADAPEEEPAGDDSEDLLPEDGTYTTKEDVALYIYQYGKLPSNFITKKQAEKLGWEGGSLEPYAPGKCIGGSRFGNYEGLLPEEDGRSYTECDIDTLGAKKRGAKRIVFSNDGLIYYTDDHYESFELLYGEE